MTKMPTLEEIAAQYGVDPGDTDCSGDVPGKQTSAQKLADQAKKAKDGRTAAK